MARTDVAVTRRREGALKSAAMMPSPARAQSKYKPEYCDIVESLGKQGKSLSEIALVLNIDRKSLNAWERQFSDFGEALARARTWAQAWWEGKAHKSLGKKHFQAQLWRYSMAGRFKEDYADNAQSDTISAMTDFLQAVTQAAQARIPGDGAKAVDVEASTSPAGRRPDEDKR